LSAADLIGGYKIHPGSAHIVYGNLTDFNGGFETDRVQRFHCLKNQTLRDFPVGFDRTAAVPAAFYPYGRGYDPNGMPRLFLSVSLATRTTVPRHTQSVVYGKAASLWAYDTY
jgi:hypothetical protein